MAISAVLLASVVAIASVGGFVGAAALMPETATVNGAVSLSATNTSASFCVTPGASVGVAWSTTGSLGGSASVELLSGSAALYGASGISGNVTLTSPGAITVVASGLGGATVSVDYTGAVPGSVLTNALGLTSTTTC